MLFNSSIFLFIFMPLTLVAFYVSRRLWVGSDKFVLIFFSLAFYGYWSQKFLLMLVFSIGLNWLLVSLVVRLNRRREWLFIGVIANLVLLGIFKYANFFSAAAFSIGVAEFRHWDIVLPLAISFFTFHQISYLIDVLRGDKHVYNFWDYLLYIIFFPHLIAGPIVRHNEFIHQIEAARSKAIQPILIAQGIALFILGLSKKMLLASPLASLADPLFETGLSGPLSLHDSIVAALSFSLQIYFDFSGYTDMALGLSLMFGYRLPPNFNAPYAARSLIDFWRNWHMTLSRFLRDYLYISMGGNRFGYVRQMVALFATMVLGGLWHGANWTFIIWGALHGLGLSLNHIVRRAGWRLPSFLSWLLTFLFVVVCFVIFRATSFEHALNMLTGFIKPQSTQSFASFGQYLLLMIAMCISTIGPTTQNIVGNFYPTKRNAFIVTCFAVISILMILSLDHNATFIYFQF